MGITLINVGKTENKHLDILLADYINRLNRFVKFKVETVPLPRSIGKCKPAQVKHIEGEMILKHCKTADFIILLDEKGKEFTSQGFSGYIQKKLNMGSRNLCFVSGGAYGFSEQVYQKANECLSLSKMTTTHQLVRLFFVEQLYRAFTILKGHPYHNI